MGPRQDFGNSMLHFLSLLARSKRGATAIEYGLIVALIGIAIITAMSSMASNTIEMWGFVETKIVPQEE